jgi:hypothetical protein
MNQFTHKTIFLLSALALLLSACGGEVTPTLDEAAVATSAVQTVEARYTQQAAQQPTATLSPTEELLPTATATFVLPPTPQPPANSGGSSTPCYSAVFLGETIYDGQIMLPGTVFTKTWTIQNTGSCAWDTSYKLTLISGDAMTTVTSIPLSRTVYPGQSVTLAIDMTAPTTEGVHTGTWRIATPYGGSFGVGQADMSLIAQITVAKKPDNAFAVTEILYQVARSPQSGCPEKGTTYTITAIIRVNGAGEVLYHWVQYPQDASKPEVYKLNFKEAGTKVVTWQWILKPGAIQGIDRRVAIFVETPNNAEVGEPIRFNWTCP